MEKPITKDNFEMFCRTCASQSEKNQSVFNYKLEPLSLVEMLKECTSIHITSSDILPKSVCENCVKLIVNLYNFKEKCQIVEKQLLNIYSGLNLFFDKDLIKRDSTKQNCYEKLKRNFTINSDSIKDEYLHKIERVPVKFNNEHDDITVNVRVKKEIKIETDSPQIENNNKEFFKSSPVFYSKKENIIKKRCQIEKENNENLKILKTEPNTAFTCEECCENFSAKVNFNTHLLTKHPTLAYKCKHCKKLFVLRSTYEKHLKEHQIICNVCFQNFESTEDLKQHSTQHRPTDKNICKECGKSFYSKSGLRTHYRTHTGEKPFLCTVCGISFALLANLRTHMRIHTGEKPYSCKMCDRTFTGHNSLKVHVVTHTKERNHQCHICPKQFRTSSILRNHVLVTHQGIRKFICDLCPKRFASGSKLRRHFITHTGKKARVSTVKQKMDI